MIGCLAVLETVKTPNSEGGNGVPEQAEARAQEGRHLGSARSVPVAGLASFAVEVRRRGDVATVQPRGELDLASVATLRAALDGIKGAGRLVLDLRGLSFIDSTGLHLLVAFHQRAQREGFRLTLVAPAPPVARAIQLCGLDKSLPFVAPVEALGSDPGE